MKKKVFVSGHFNVLHPGHLRFLKFAKECGNYLIVGVESNKIAKNAAYVDEKIRLNSIKSVSLVDEAFILRTSPSTYIAKKKPNIVVKGKEHENLENDELKVLKKYDGKLIFSSGEKMFSSIDLIQKEFSYHNFINLKKPKEYFYRHQVKEKKLLSLIKNFSKLKVCVIGDLIIDEYITCDTLGMSNEEPSLVVSPVDKKKFVGGAGIVAAHAAGLGAKVDLITILGNDKNNIFVKKKLNEYKVSSTFFVDHARPTTLKQRYRCSGKTLLKVSHLHQNSISKNLQKKIFNKLSSKIKKYDLIVFSDFNYGCLPSELVEKMISLGKKNKKFMVADCQSSSQIGDLLKYKKMNLITPTEREARICTKNNDDGLVVLAEDLRKKLFAENIILKLGKEGVIIHSLIKKFPDTDQIEALNLSPEDSAGAGDSLLISSAMSLVSRGNIWESAYLGSLCSAIQVGRVGNIPIRKTELIEII